MHLVTQQSYPNLLVVSCAHIKHPLDRNSSLVASKWQIVSHAPKLCTNLLDVSREPANPSQRGRDPLWWGIARVVSDIFLFFVGHAMHA